MCKRYYIEVTGLGDDGEQQLEAAGVARNAILVVDRKEKHGALVRALQTATGMTKHEIFHGTGDRRHVSARVAYVHFAIIDGDSADGIAHDLSKNRRYIREYVRWYERRLFGDKDFKCLILRLTELLDHDPYWRPPDTEKPVRSKKKGNRMLRKGNIKKNDIRQLTINFEDYE